MSANMTTHLAAYCAAKAAPLQVEARPTPEPGPGEIVIAVRAVALNIVDTLMRDMGYFVPTYPTVLGSDIAGEILAVGPPGTVPEYLTRPGTRVAALSSVFFHQGDPKYGAFQERVLVPATTVCPVPEDMRWEEAASLPMGVLVASAAWEVLGIPISPTAPAQRDENGITIKRAVLIWGAATGVGTMAVQSARLMGYHVVATASPGNFDYIRSLGADVVFDYHDTDAAERDIVKHVRERGLVMKDCFFGYGSVSPCQNIFLALNGVDGGSVVAHAPPLLPTTPQVDGVQVRFIEPASEPAARDEQFSRWFNVWLRENLASGKIRPSPKAQVVGTGLGDIDRALTELKEKGVKCAKPVVMLD